MSATGRVLLDRRPARRAAPARAARSPSRVRLEGWLAAPLLLWAALWLSINTGPWTLAEFGAGLRGSVNALRAAAPLGVLALAVFALAGTRRRVPRSWVEYGFWGYGAVMLLAATGADRWFNQAYWGFAFLATLTVVEAGLRSEDPLGFARRLNWLSWGLTVAALVTLLILAREVLLDQRGSAYGAIVRFEAEYGYTISRSTGMARMAAVPGIIALVFIVTRRSWQRALSCAALAGSLYVLWIMQARGAVFAFAGAMGFVLLFGPRKLQKLGLLLAVGVVFVAVLGSSEDGFREFWMHITRDQGVEGFSTMSGRDVIFANAIDHWVRAPLFGYGPQADRLFTDVRNAQNALLYALLSAGLVGTVFFLVAFASAWIALLRANLHHRAFTEREREMLMITSGILVFSTLRSIPENQAALFSVDLLLQYPAMIYLALLVAAGRARGSVRFWRVGRPAGV